MKLAPRVPEVCRHVIAHANHVIKTTTKKWEKPILADEHSLVEDSGLVFIPTVTGGKNHGK